MKTYKYGIDYSTQFKYNKKVTYAILKGLLSYVKKLIPNKKDLLPSEVSAFEKNVNKELEWYDRKLVGMSDEIAENLLKLAKNVKGDKEYKEKVKKELASLVSEEIETIIKLRKEALKEVEKNLKARKSIYKKILKGTIDLSKYEEKTSSWDINTLLTGLIMLSFAVLLFSQAMKISKEACGTYNILKCLKDANVLILVVSAAIMAFLAIRELWIAYKKLSTKVYTIKGQKFTNKEIEKLKKDPDKFLKGIDRSLQNVANLIKHNSSFKKLLKDTFQKLYKNRTALVFVEKESDSDEEFKDKVDKFLSGKIKTLEI